MKRLTVVFHEKEWSSIPLYFTEEILAQICDLASLEQLHLDFQLHDCERFERVSYKDMNLDLSGFFPNMRDFTLTIQPLFTADMSLRYILKAHLAAIAATRDFDDIGNSEMELERLPKAVYREIPYNVWYHFVKDDMPVIIHKFIAEQVPLLFKQGTFKLDVKPRAIIIFPIIRFQGIQDEDIRDEDSEDEDSADESSQDGSSQDEGSALGLFLTSFP